MTGRVSGEREVVLGRRDVSRAGRLALIFASATFFDVPAFAQDLVHTPVSPTFGGNPFNSAHILGTAGAQNDYKDPSTSAASNSQADLFSRQLQSRLLSALSAQITDAIFGPNPQESGTITFGGQTVSFVRSLESVSLTITNNETGEVTNIEIPTFIKVN
jgi:curli production assembly/transport component CsgF